MFCQNDYTEEATSAINTFNKEITEIVQNKYQSLKEDLKKIQQNFTEDELKKNPDTEEQFEQLRLVRKMITQCYVGRDKAIKATNLQTTTKTLHMPVQKEYYSKQITKTKHRRRPSV